MSAAWDAWRRADALDRRWKKEMLRISRDIEFLKADLDLALADEITTMLARIPRYRRTVDAFLDLRGYTKTMEGWQKCCGTDVGLFRKTKKLGWALLWRALLESRKLRCTEPCAERKVH